MEGAKKLAEREGIRTLRVGLATATSNLGTNVVQAVLTIFALRTLRFTTAELGLVGSIGAVGFLAGVLVVNRFTTKVGLGRTLALSIAVPGVFVLYPLAALGYPFLVLAGVSFVVGLSVPSYNVNQISLRQAITPDRLQGRMNATMRTIVWGTIPVGSLLGGLLGNNVGVVDTMYTGGAIAALAGAWIALGPVIKLKRQPEPVRS